MRSRGGGASLCSVPRIEFRLAEAEPAFPEAVPKAKLCPVGRLPRLVGLGVQKWIGQKHCDLLFVVAIEQAQSPRNRRAFAIETAIKLGARGLAVLRQRWGRAFMRADAKMKMRHPERSRPSFRYRSAETAGGTRRPRPE
jgi:hypothetical protein